MIKDEFEQLLQSISNGYENTSQHNADDIVLKTYKFFSRLKEELKDATGEEKDELLGMIKTMQEKVSEYSRKSCEKVGMSEDQLMQLTDDSEIFTPDQKRVLEMAKQDMIESSKTIRTHMKDRHVEHKAIPVQEEAPKKKSKKKKKPRGWLKS